MLCYVNVLNFMGSLYPGFHQVFMKLQAGWNPESLHEQYLSTNVECKRSPEIAWDSEGKRSG